MKNENPTNFRQTKSGGNDHWKPPQGTNFTLTVGTDDVTSKCLSGKLTSQQIDFVRTLKCGLVYEGNDIALDRIMLEVREPQTLISHQK